MAKLNLSQAAKVTGKNRTTIWRHINNGRLSAERDRDGNPFVDTSELLRVYGELKKPATHSNSDEQHKATPLYSELIETINSLRLEQAEMKQQITMLTNRLTYQPEELAIDKQKSRPEDHKDWPKEILTIADINLRNEIKNKYK